VRNLFSWCPSCPGRGARGSRAIHSFVHGARRESRECRGHGRVAQGRRETWPLSLSLSLSLSRSRRSGSLIRFITVMDSAVSQSEVIHLHAMNICIFFSPKPTQRAFIAISDQRKINEKRCNNSFKQYNTSVSGPEDQGKVRGAFAQKRLRSTGL
jgi:hypothetical protein